jgi:hypothetical protein
MLTPYEIQQLLRLSRNTKIYTFPTKKKNQYYCECCNSIKPSNEHPKVKGWKCTECLKKDCHEN